MKRLYSKKVAVGETCVEVLDSIYSNLMAPRFWWISIANWIIQSFHNFNMLFLTRFATLDFKLGLKFRLFNRVKKWLILKVFCSVLGIWAKMAYFEVFWFDSMNMCQNGLFWALYIGHFGPPREVFRFKIDLFVTS